LIGNTLSDMNRASYVAAQAFPGEYEITVHRNWGQALGNRARLEVIQHFGSPREARRLVLLNLDQKQIVKVTLAEGRRTTLAVVPPPQRAETVEENERRSSVYEKLRQLVDPDYASAKVMRGGAYTPGAQLPTIPERNVRGKQPERRVFQTGLQAQGGQSVNMAAQARLSADQNYLRVSVTPVFQTANRQGPAVNLPLIPGGANP
jgi:hypothetical protein